MTSTEFLLLVAVGMAGLLLKDKEGDGDARFAYLVLLGACITVAVFSGSLIALGLGCFCVMTLYVIKWLDGE